MKLSIYGKKDGKRAVIKTYTAETYSLLWGTCEDVLNALNIDHMETGSNREIIKMALDLLLHSKETVNELFLDIFEGLTAEELRNAQLDEMATVLVEVVRYTIGQIGLLPKN